MVNKILSNLKNWLRAYPSLFLWAKALYFRRSLTSGVRLNVYAAGKSCLECYNDLGSGRGMIEVKTLFTTINSGTERANFMGLPNTKFKFPNQPGGSGIGKIIKGRNRSLGMKKGDIVAGAFLHASKDVLDPKSLTKVKHGVQLEQMAFIHLAIIALQGLRMGKVHSGSKVVVIGQGVIGRIATLLCRAIDAETMVVTRTNHKLLKFQELRGVSLDEKDAIKNLSAFSPDVVIDASGSPEAIHLCKKIISDDATIVLLGSNRGITGDLIFESQQSNHKAYKIVGAHIRNIQQMPKEYGGNYQQEANFIQDLMLQKRLDLSELVTTKINCEQLAQYYNNQLPLASDGGVIIDWQDNSKLKNELSTTPKYDGPPTLRFEQPKVIAIIGCGDSGFTHAKELKDGNSYRVGMVMDVNLKLAEKLGEFAQCPFTNNYQDVLENPEIDTILITVPHYLHKDLSIKAAEHKKHILVDKPLAIQISDAEEVLKAAIENDVLLATFQQRIMEPTQVFSKQLIEMDAVGNILGASLEYQRDKTMDYWLNKDDMQLSWRAIKEKSGGGFIMMNLIHELDYFRFITNREFASINAKTATLHHPIKVEDSIGALFTLDNGAIGTISASSVTKGHGAQCMRIWGDSGQIVINVDQVSFFSHKKLGTYDSMRWHTINFDYYISRCIFFDEFRRRVEAGEKTTMNERGIQSLKVAQALYKSSDLNQTVFLN